MSLDTLLQDHQKLAYADNVRMVAQQTGNVLRPYVTELSASGESVAVSDLFGKVEAIEVQGRIRSNLENVPKLDRRWAVFPNPVYSGQYCDTEDKLRMMTDPTSSLVRVHTMAVQRAIQDRIMGVRPDGSGVFKIDQGGILGTVTEGKRPSSSKALPAAQTTVHGSTGLTMDKLIGVIEKFGTSDVDIGAGQIYMAIAPKQVTDLLNIAKATENNLNAFEVQQLKDGKPTPLMGINFIVTNRLPKSGTTRSCPEWSRDNVVLAVWEDINGAAYPDSHADNTPYVRVRARVDCVRVEDVGVQVVECTEA